MIRLADVGGGMPLFQLKIALRGSKPRIWRRVVMRADMPLNRLHQVIQIVMGWADSHLHQFVAGGVFYGVPDPEFEDLGRKTLNEKRYSLADLAREPKKKFMYEYDFGDSWEHEVLLEKVLPPDTAFQHPVCLTGANACPPEDCGGIYGYYEFLAAMGDPEHKQHQEMMEWIGGEWDADRFDLEAANERLSRLKA